MATSFRYDAQGVPILGKSDIEGVSADVLKWGLEKSSDIELPIAILEIYKKLSDKGELYLRYEELNPLGTGAIILGKFCYGSPPTIVLDVEHEQTSTPARTRFTLAHELGHFVLHRDRPLPMRKDFVDTEDDLPRHFSAPKKNRNRLEWQANYFAAALLIPAEILLRRLIAIQNEMGVKRNVGKIYVDDTATSRRDYRLMLNKLIQAFQVSRTCMEIRLRGLGLLEDHRGEGPGLLADTIGSFFVEPPQ